MYPAVYRGVDPGDGRRNCGLEEREPLCYERIDVNCYEVLACVKRVVVGFDCNGGGTWAAAWDLEWDGEGLEVGLMFGFSDC